MTNAQKVLNRQVLLTILVGIVVLAMPLLSLAVEWYGFAHHSPLVILAGAAFLLFYALLLGREIWGAMNEGASAYAYAKAGKSWS